MTEWRLCCAAILLIAILPSKGLSAERRFDSHKQALQHFGGGNVIPPELAGIWVFTDTIRVCGDPTILFVLTGDDTLCAGEPYDAGGTYTCSGTVTATTIDLTCTDSYDENGCVYNSVQTIQGTRSGVTILMHSTTNVTYSPPGCNKDGCIDASIRMTRTADPPKSCATVPTLKTTWGKLKKQFR